MVIVAVVYPSAPLYYGPICRKFIQYSFVLMFDRM